MVHPASGSSEAATWTKCLAIVASVPNLLEAITIEWQFDSLSGLFDKQYRMQAQAVHSLRCIIG